MPGTQISAKEISKHMAHSRPKSMRVEQAANGGFVVTHDNDEYPQPKHAFKNHNEMIKHIKSHFGCAETAPAATAGKDKK